MRLIKKYQNTPGPITFAVYPKGFGLWSPEAQKEWRANNPNAEERQQQANEDQEHLIQTRSNIPQRFIYTDPETGMQTPRYYSGRSEALNQWNPEAFTMTFTNKAQQALSTKGAKLLFGLAGAAGISRNADEKNLSPEAFHNNFLGKGDDWIQATADLVGGEARPSRATTRDSSGKIVQQEAPRKLNTGYLGAALNQGFNLMLGAKGAGIAAKAMVPIIGKITPGEVPALFEKNRWFGELGQRFDEYGNPKWNAQDEAELASHIPEYQDIVADAIRNNTLMEVPEGFPNSQMINGKNYFIGPIEAWIQSQSENFNRWRSQYGKKLLEIGYKGGIDKYNNETLPRYQPNGLFFARDESHAARFGMNPLHAWLGFNAPYDMTRTGVTKFPLEDGAVAMLRKSNYNPQMVQQIRKIWAADHLDNPAIMDIIQGDPSRLTPELRAQNDQLLYGILTKQAATDTWKARTDFGDRATRIIKGQKMAGGSSEKYDGLVGPDHTLGVFVPKEVTADDPLFAIEQMKNHAPIYGAHPISQVITVPEQAKLVLGNSGAFNGAAYSRKKGGRINKVH